MKPADIAKNIEQIIIEARSDIIPVNDADKFCRMYKVLHEIYVSTELEDRIQKLENG